jgi:hypothetical protein
VTNATWYSGAQLFPDYQVERMVPEFEKNLLRELGMYPYS